MVTDSVEVHFCTLKFMYILCIFYVYLLEIEDQTAVIGQLHEEVKQKEEELNQIKSGS